jgi:hypothetical protein
MKAVWTSRLGSLARDQLPFAISQALNDTAREAATEARTAAAKGLNVKKRGLLTLFIRNPSEFKATKQRHSARVMVGGPKSDPARGNILTQQEESGSKRPFRGRFVAMPSREISAKVGGKRVLKAGNELRNFKPFSTPVDSGNATPNGKRGTRIEGRKNTFVVFRKGSGLPILLQRYGRGKQQTRALWLWVKQTRLVPRLGFGKAVLKVVRRDLDTNIGRRLTQAIASAKVITKGGGVTSSRLP